jgi:hypothetical protein
VNPHIADFAAERSDFDRVLSGVRSILNRPAESLHSLDALVEILRDVGLVPIPEAQVTYEGEEECINGTQQGLIQLPREFARWLLLLGEHRPSSYLEIGCFNGASASLAAAYLHRVAPGSRLVTCDVFPAFLFHADVAALVPLEYHVGRTSFDFAREKFEAVFIDGDHSFEWAWADYQNVGRSARICGLHDVNNAPYRELHLGGVCGVWDWIRASEGGAGVEFREIFEHPSREIMGIGVRIRGEAG